MKNQIIEIVCGATLLVATIVVVVVALCERQTAPLPDVPMAQTLAEVRVKTVERKAETVERGRDCCGGRGQLWMDWRRR